MNRVMYAIVSAAFAYGSYEVLTDLYIQPLISGLLAFGWSFFLLKTIMGD